MHACFVADELGIRRIVLPLAAGVFSALGAALADFRYDYVRTLPRRMSALELSEVRVGARGDGGLRPREAAGLPVTAVRIDRAVDLRYVGQSFEIPVQVDAGRYDKAEMLERFHRLHDESYGFSDTNEPVELVNVRLTAFGETPRPPCLLDCALRRCRRAGPRPTGPFLLSRAANRWSSRCTIAPASSLALGYRGRPSLPTPTPRQFCFPGWTGEVDARGNILHGEVGESHHETDPVLLEILKGSLVAVTEEMGIALMKASYSPNIKTRKDHTCCLFDNRLEMVAQTAHQIGHLGAFPYILKTVMQEHRVEDLRPGDQIIVNDPYRGGTHLPDIIMISPLFERDRLWGYVANLAHHSDVGGMSPGSMPGTATEIYQEGIRIPAVKLFRAGTLQEELLKTILANVRTPEERQGDLMAQVAANNLGIRRVHELIRRLRLRAASQLLRGPDRVHGATDEGGDREDARWDLHRGRLPGRRRHHR